MMEASLAQDPGMAGVNPPLRHPGPVVEPRVSAIPTAIRQFDITLTGEIPLEEAILTAFADQGLTGGAVEIDGLECTALDYVIPAQSEFPDRLAWYSAPRSPKGPARILQGYASVGMDHGVGMTHCHGIWRLADGRRAVLVAVMMVLVAECSSRAGALVGVDDVAASVVMAVGGGGGRVQLEGVYVGWSRRCCCGGGGGGWVVVA